jgi:hypothetical protein
MHTSGVGVKTLMTEVIDHKLGMIILTRLAINGTRGYGLVSVGLGEDPLLILVKT